MEDSTLSMPSEWTREAACLNRPVEWFEIPDQAGSGNKARSNVKKGMRVCKGCPVATQCLAEASPEDLWHTVRGGLWPEGLTHHGPGRPGRPKAPKGPPRPAGKARGLLIGRDFSAARCFYGHDRTILGRNSNGSCVACLIAVKEGTYVDPPTGLKGVWQALTHCPGQNHPLPAVEDRTGAFCPVCQAEAKRAADRRREDVRRTAPSEEKERINARKRTSQKKRRDAMKAALQAVV